MKRLFLSLLLAFIAVMPMQVRAQIIEPVKWSIAIQDLNETEFDLVATATIDPEYHIYSTTMPALGPLPTVFDIKTSEFFEAVGEARDLTEVPMYYDDIFEVEYKQFAGTAQFAQTFRKLKDGGFPITGEITYQACKDGQCVSLTEDVDLQYGEPAVIEAAEPEANTGSKSNIWSMILEAILWGFAALLTPCVFPMIPMTVSFFMHGEGESKAQGRFKAFMYFVFIVALYTLPIAIIILVTWLVGGNSVTADIFNWLATHWLPNIIFFLVFMIFAASFFGVSSSWP